MVFGEGMLYFALVNHILRVTKPITERATIICPNSLSQIGAWGLRFNWIRRSAECLQRNLARTAALGHDGKKIYNHLNARERDDACRMIHREIVIKKKIIDFRLDIILVFDVAE
jgi:hypothetical protein